MKGKLLVAPRGNYEGLFIALSTFNSPLDIFINYLCLCQSRSFSRLIKAAPLEWRGTGGGGVYGISIQYHYVTVVVKSWNIILVSPHIRRTEICRILPSFRRELRNIIGDRAASRPLCQSPVNIIVIPLVDTLKTVNDCSPASWENQTIQYPDRSGPGKIPPTESGNGKRGSNSNVMCWIRLCGNLPYPCSLSTVA